MILRTEELKDVCNKILPAVDGDGTISTETLQLQVEQNTFKISVTNREYFVTVCLPIERDVPFNATVFANMFLKLISQITTDTIELITDETTLLVKGNGTYRLPMIFEDDKLLKLTKINIDNPTINMQLRGEILNSILQYNSKELLKIKDINTIRPIQRYYYVDDQGAITFTTGACVNNFKLEKPIKVLLNNKVVKLFKLFDEDDIIDLSLGHTVLEDGITQTRIKFESNKVSISAILLSDDAMIRLVPVTQIRDRANHEHNHSVCFNKDELLRAINRFLLLANAQLDVNKFVAKLEFGVSGVTIRDGVSSYNELVYYVADTPTLNEPYKAMLNLNELKLCVEAHNGNTVTLNFGDHQAFVLSRGKIKNVLSEIIEV